MHIEKVTVNQKHGLRPAQLHSIVPETSLLAHHLRVQRRTARHVDNVTVAKCFLLANAALPPVVGPKTTDLIGPIRP